MRTLVQDLRFGWRMMARNPGFTAVAVIALALGIGANTAIFSVVDAVVLQPLPIHQPDRVVAVHEQFTRIGLSSIGVSAPDFKDLSGLSNVFESAAVISNKSYNLTGSGHPERLNGFQVTGGFFPMMGAKPLLGRWLLPSEDRPGADREVVLSEGVWKRAFGRDPKILGASIILDGQNYTVVGVMPASFDMPNLAPDLWTPLALTPAQLDPVKERSHQWLYMLARLRPGISLAQADAAVHALAKQHMREYPNFFPAHIGYDIFAVQLLPDLIGKTGKFLFVLLAAVGFVLLIACANVANLMLARASARSREIAVRVVLGAGRLRIIRQLLTESVMLAVIGGALGLLIAVWGIDIVKTIGPHNVPRLTSAGLDGTVLAFTAAAALITGILFGLAPALDAARRDLHETLKEGGRSGSASASRQRLRGALVAGEIALTLVLLIGGVLMTESFVHLLNANPGFDPHNVLTLQLSLSPARYSKPAQISSFYNDLLSRVSHLPGVQAAGAIDVLPFNHFGNSGSFLIEGMPAGRGIILPHADVRRVMPGVFSALRVPLERGRAFTSADSASAPHVAVVDDVLAKTYWPGQDPIGHRVAMVGATPDWFTVVGVVGNIRNRGFSAPPKGVLYFPLAQWPKPHMSLVLRTSSNPAGLAPAVRRVVHGIDNEQPVYDVKTMDQYISESFSDQRLDVFLLAVFAGLALVLASIGIYGVITYAVSQRTHEIGIRAALGAQPADILKMVVGQGLRLALIGAGAGIVAALALTRLMASLLYGVRPADPLTFVAVSIVLVAVAIVACTIPARRATKVDPVTALRNE